MRNRLGPLLVSSLVLSIAACGGGGGDPDGEPDPDADDTGFDSAPSDAQPTMDADLTVDADLTADADLTPDAILPDAGPTTNEGIVIVAEQVQGGAPQGTADATIFMGPMFGMPIGTVGACDVHTTLSMETLSAGVINITGTTTPITLTPDSAVPPVLYIPSPDPIPDDVFATGAMIDIATAGGQVPAFSGTVVAPAPLGGAVFPAAVSRSLPTPVAWTAGTGESSWIWVIGIDNASGDAGIVWCRSTDSGSFSVPAAAVAMFPASYTLALVVVWRVNDTSVTAGSFAIELTATTAVGGDPVMIVP